jgi:D-proline reductase (dithiol) PrdB
MNGDLGFASGEDVPISYMQRIRDYYLALGYPTPYRWAHYAEVPFQPLEKPLSRCRVALVTTAAPYQEDKGDQGPGAPYNAAANSMRSIRGAVPTTTICGYRICRSRTT